MAFAEGTTVDVSKTRAEIESLARKHGASQFGSGWSSGGEAGITFVIKDRRVQFRLAMPTGQEKAIADKARRMSRQNWGTPDAAKLRLCIDAEERRLWRCLLLAIKAKLEIVASGIATFEEEFLAHVVTDNGLTVYERIREGGMKMLTAAPEATNG